MESKNPAQIFLTRRFEKTLFRTFQCLDFQGWKRGFWYQNNYTKDYEFPDDRTRLF